MLVTFDNKLTAEHAADIRDGPISVAVIDAGGRPDDLSFDTYQRDVVHRHAHRFVDQDAGTAYRYRATARRTRIELVVE